MPIISMFYGICPDTLYEDSIPTAAYEAALVREARPKYKANAQYRRHGSKPNRKS